MQIGEGLKDRESDDVFVNQHEFATCTECDTVNRIVRSRPT